MENYELENRKIVKTNSSLLAFSIHENPESRKKINASCDVKTSTAKRLFIETSNKDKSYGEKRVTLLMNRNSLRVVGYLHYPNFPSRNNSTISYIEFSSKSAKKSIKISMERTKPLVTEKYEFQQGDE